MENESELIIKSDSGFRGAKKFRKGFLIDENNIETFRDKLATIKYSDGTPANYIYTVTQSDGYFVKLESLEDIIKENADRSKKITGLSILAEDNDDFKIIISFDDDSGVSLEVAGHGKQTQAYHEMLIDYLVDEIVTLRFILPLKPFFLFFAWAYTILFVIFFIGYFIVTDLEPSSDSLDFPNYPSFPTPSFSAEQVNMILDGDNLGDKLNLIITSDPSFRDFVFPELRATYEAELEDYNEARDAVINEYDSMNSSFPFESPSFAFWLPLMILAFAMPVVYLFAYLTPVNIFLFGREKQRYERRLQLRSNWFWTILIGGFGIALVANAAIYLLDIIF